MIDLPPKWIIKAARLALKKKNRWSDAIAILCSYYGIPLMLCYKEPAQVSKGAIACYKTSPNGDLGYCYSKSPNGSSADTIFHELGHHLNQFLFDHKLNAESNEAFAEVFAKEMCRLWKKNSTSG